MKKLQPLHSFKWSPSVEAVELPKGCLQQNNVRLPCKKVEPGTTFAAMQWDVIQQGPVLASHIHASAHSWLDYYVNLNVVFLLYTSQSSQQKIKYFHDNFPQL